MSDANGAELGVAGVASVLPPSYVDFKDLIRSEMTAVKAKMTELRKLHGQVCVPLAWYPVKAETHATGRIP